jgi:hypothetical protein
MAAAKSAIPELELFIDSPPSSVRIGLNRLHALADVPEVQIFFREPIRERGSDLARRGFPEQ